MPRPPLRIDATFRNTNNWQNEADVFNKMFKQFSDGKGIQNVGGFRYKGKARQVTGIQNAAFVVLVTTFKEGEWPDNLDVEHGVFTYYGDNRAPGAELHDTHIGGNLLLRDVFEDLYSGSRENTPPFLCFESFGPSGQKFMRFLGLAIPGANNAGTADDLVAVWRTQNNQRFQNYRATFTILDEEKVDWAWLDDLVGGVPPHLSKFCPTTWQQFVKNGKAKALRCLKSKLPRTKEEQLPKTNFEHYVLEQVLTLSDREFEFASKSILELADPNYIDLEVTKAIIDGGRDIIGKYRIGHAGDEILLDLFGEVKRWAPNQSIGVKPMSRLISRIKHRDFGVFITTSYFHKQVQKELIEDHHPILLLSGGDIAKLLIKTDIANDGSPASLNNWLNGHRLTDH